MSPPETFALREYLGPELKGRTISDARHSVSLTDILGHSCPIGRSRELSGRSVLLAASGQLQSALAMIELDGVARRMFLCPPDLDPGLIPALLADAEIDAIVTDRPDRCDAGTYLVVGVGLPERAAAGSRKNSGSLTTEGSNPSRISRCLFCLKVSVASSSRQNLTKTGRA